MKQTNGLTPRGSQVRELLEAYQGVLDTTRGLPLAPRVLWRHGDRGGLGRIHYLPRPRWLLRYFVVSHIDRVLASLSRRYSARAALGSAPDSDQRDREAVREFQQSLPPTRHKIYLILLIVATVLLGRPIVDRVVTIVLNMTELNDSSLAGSPELRQQVRETVERLSGALTPDFTTVNEALRALLNGGLKQVALVLLGLALSLYVVLRPFVPAFRLKRMLFNLAPESKERRRSASARWSVPQTTGIYERERTLFKELGGQALREFPFDLAVPALAMLAPLVLGGLFVRLGYVDPIVEDRPIDLGIGVWLFIVALLRLGWLYQTWRRRQGGHKGPCMPFEVRIRRSRALAEVKTPLSVAILALLVSSLFLLFAIMGRDRNPEIPVYETVLTVFMGTLIWSLPFSLPWWYRLNRELRDLDKSYGMQSFGRKPSIPLLMMTVGWLAILPPFISVFRTGRCIQRAQARADLPKTLRSPWMLAPGLFLFPFLFAYLQHELNKVWAIEGELLDPWTARVFSEHEVYREHAMAPSLVGSTTELAGG
jgi:hypothetical protein